jgi:CheY-like chemotaxis protein
MSRGAAATAERRSRILIVEDEGIVAWDIEKNLRDLGFEVVGVAASGREALALAKSGQPDLILMDIRIQGDIDGITTAELVRRQLGIPVVYLTAHGDPETLERAKGTAPVGYLIKPI